MPDGPSAPATLGPIPGVVVVWSGATPTVQAFRIPQAGLVLGRELLDHTTDDRISRQHARVMWRDKRFVVTDLGSRNGTYAGGHALVDREVTVTPPSVVRTGRTVSVLMEDVRKFEGAQISSQHDAIVGASTHLLWKDLEASAYSTAVSNRPSPIDAHARWFHALVFHSRSSPAARMSWFAIAWHVL
jgi:predicted component of type VI protein secretion system